MKIKTRLVVLIALLIIFIAAMAIYISWILFDIGLPLGGIVYISLTAFWIYAVYYLKFRSGISLWIGFLLFTIGSVFAIPSIFIASEPIFRFSFVFFTIGITQSLIEYTKRNAKR
jgi:hypothetical protein